MMPCSTGHHYQLCGHSYSFSSCDEQQTLAFHYPKQPNPIPSPNLFPFSPFVDDLLLFHTSDTAAAALPEDFPAVKKNEAAPSSPEKISDVKRSSRKRPLRKDRHSKIDTAQGPRDRRMRLSLDVARKFFDLQELLGFDKPSKTVQWLLNESRSAINELSAATAVKGTFKSESTTSSECEETSTVSYCKAKPSSEAKERTRNAAAARACRKNDVVKATRAKARERARERTMTKKLMLKQPVLPSSPSIQFETIQSMISHEPKISSTELVAETDHDQVDYQMNFLGSNEAISIILEQWDGCNIHPRLWEAYTNRIL